LHLDGPSSFRGGGRVIALTLLVQAAVPAAAPAPRPQDTEVWSPQPPVVAPRPPAPAPPPRGAVVLFDGRNADAWVSHKDGGPARWRVVDGAMVVAGGTGNIRTRASFGSYRLHLEYRIPTDVTGEGQGRGNSGLFLASTGPGDQGYEVQILDGQRNPTYVNGQVGSIYKQFAPLANPSRGPGEWQAYDIDWTAPRFAADGKLLSPARATVRLNGVLVQDDVALRGETVYVGQPSYHAHGRAPIKLQDHGNPVAFRNIWVAERR